MTKVQEERLVKALEGISLGLNAIAKIEEDKFNREFPPEKETVDAEIFRQGDKQGQELSPEPGKFERLFRGAKGQP